MWDLIYGNPNDDHSTGVAVGTGYILWIYFNEAVFIVFFFLNEEAVSLDHQPNKERVYTDNLQHSHIEYDSCFCNQLMLLMEITFSNATFDKVPFPCVFLAIKKMMADQAISLMEMTFGIVHLVVAPTSRYHPYPCFFLCVLFS